MQTLRRLSVYVGIHGAKVNERGRLERQDNCQLRAIKKRNTWRLTDNEPPVEMR